MERDRGSIRRTLGIGTVCALGAATFAGLGAYEWMHDASGELPEISSDAIPRTSTNLCFLENPNCSDGEGMTILYSEGNQIPKTLAEVDDDIEAAAIFGEDKRYYLHDGVDDRSIARAFVADVLASAKSMGLETAQGASTIEMQLWRNAYLKDKNLSETDRKKSEIDNAPLLDKHFEEIVKAQNPTFTEEQIKHQAKQLILEQYLNYTYFGRNAYGVEAAATAYYGIPSSDLSVDRSATIIALLNAPSWFEGSLDPTRNQQQMQDLKERRDEIIQDMADGEYISQEDAATFKQMPIDITPYHTQTFGQTADYTVADTLGLRYAVDTILQQAKQLSGYDDKQLRSNLAINTTISYYLQAQVSNEIKKTIAQLPKDGRQLAAVFIREDGSIASMYGGDYATSQVNLTLQPQPGGSADKPYFVTEALIKGTTSADMRYQETDPFVWENGTNGQDWLPTGGVHCNDSNSCGYKEGLAVSSNPVILQIAEDMGPGGVDDTYKLMDALGSHSDSIPVPAAVLGARETSLLGRTTAMNNLIANQGETHETHIINTVYQNTGKSLVNKYAYSPPDPVRVVDSAIAADITDALRGTATYYTDNAKGTAYNALHDEAALTDIAGKTGTDDENKVANFFGTTAIVTPEGEQYNLTGGIALRFVDGLKPLGAYQTGGKIPATLYGDIIRPFISSPGRIN